MLQGSAGVESFERAEGHKFPQELQEIVPSSGEDIPELCSRVMFELYVVRQLGHSRPGLLSWCPQSQENLPQLVQVSLTSQEGDPERRRIIY